MATGFDPEAEQEVDFARYGRMLARRWWLVAVGVVAGAVIGYLVSVGGNKLYAANAVVFLGQPYSSTGALAITTLQTNPSAVGTVVSQQSVQEAVANVCKTSVKDFGSGISTQSVSTGAAAKGPAANVNPLVKVAVQAKSGKVAACAANGLAAQVVERIGGYADAQIANYENHIAFDKKDIKSIQDALAGTSLDTDGKLILLGTLRSDQLDLATYNGYLIQAQTVSKPSVVTSAASHQVTAQSSRNTVVIAALIGLILGVLGALLWDRILPRLTARNGS